jgi:hypothetical protein
MESPVVVQPLIASNIASRGDSVLLKTNGNEPKKTAIIQIRVTINAASGVLRIDVSTGLNAFQRIAPASTHTKDGNKKAANITPGCL